MTDTDYRQTPAWANSDLTALLNYRKGYVDKPINPKAAMFGTTCHTMLLQPEIDKPYRAHKSAVEQLQLISMQRAWKRELERADPYGILTPGFVDVERPLFWTCPQTGLPCKLRYDGLTASRIVDLKTTSARSAGEFWESISQYDYDRQAAYYLDGYHLATGDASIGPYDFLFIGISKIKPHELFMVDMSFHQSRRDLIDRAREKNARLLGDAAAEMQKPDGWRPTGWKLDLHSTVSHH